MAVSSIRIKICQTPTLLRIENSSHVQKWPHDSSLTFQNHFQRFLLSHRTEREENSWFIMPSPLSVPLSEGGLFLNNGWSNNNYLFESRIQNLNFKIRFVLTETMICPPVDRHTDFFLPRRLTSVSTCGHTEFGPEDWQVEFFFFFIESCFSYIAPNNSKLFSVFFWVRSHWNEKMPQMSAIMTSKITRNHNSWGGTRDANFSSAGLMHHAGEPP